jgi:hypothetical protein
MSTSKKIFLALAVIFFGLLMYASYDISQRTTFPGSKGQLKERIKRKLGAQKADSIQSKKSDQVDSTANMVAQPPK